MRAARDIKDAKSVEKRDKTEATTCKSDVFLLEMRADKLRKYRPPTSKLPRQIRRPSLSNGSKVSEEKIQKVIESNRVPQQIIKRYEYKSVDETICKLATKLELNQLVAQKTMLVEKLLVAVTVGAENAIDSKMIEEVDKTFSNNGPSLSRLPSFMGVVDRCLHLHKLLCETKEKLNKADIQNNKLLKEANARVLAPIAKGVFPPSANSSNSKNNDTTTNNNNNNKKKNNNNNNNNSNLESRKEEEKKQLIMEESQGSKDEEILNELKVKHENEIKELNKKLSNLEKQRKAAVTSIRAMTNTVKAHETHISDLENKLKNEMNRNNNNKLLQEQEQQEEDNRNNERNNQNEKEYKLKLAEKGTQITELNAKLKALGVKYDTMKKEFDVKNEHCDTYKKQLEKLDSKLQKEMEKNQIIFDSNDKMTNETNQYKDQLDNANIQIEKLEQKLTNVESEFESTKLELKSTSDDYQKLLETLQESLNERQKSSQHEEELRLLKIELKDMKEKWTTRENELIEAGVNTLAREKQFEKERNEALKELERIKVQLKTAVEVPKIIERLSKESSERYHNMVSEQSKELSKLRQQMSVDEMTIKSLNEEIKILKKQIQELTDSRGAALMKASGMSRTEFEDTFEAVMREEFDAMRAAYEKRLTMKQHEMDKIKRTCNKEVRDAIDSSKQKLVRLEMATRRKDAEIESLTEKILGSSKQN